MGIRIRREPRRPAPSLAHPFNDIENDTTWCGIKDDDTVSFSDRTTPPHEDISCVKCGNKFRVNPTTKICRKCKDNNK